MAFNEAKSQKTNRHSEPGMPQKCYPTENELKNMILMDKMA